MNSERCALVLAAFISILFFLLLRAAVPPATGLLLSLKIRGPADLYRIYYDRGRGYSPADSVELVFSGSDHDFTGIQAKLPPIKLNQLRIDLGSKITSISIAELCLAQIDPPKKSRCWNGSELEKQFRPRRDIADFKTAAEILNIKTYGRRPFFESNPEISPELTELSAAPRLNQIFIALVFGICLFGIMLVLPDFGLGVERTSSRYFYGAIKTVAIVGFGIVIFSAGQAISLIVPPFQGPDENDHLGKLVSFEREAECGAAPSEFAAVLSDMTPLMHHAEQKMTPARVAQIFSPAKNSGDSSVSDVTLGRGACAYNRAYLLPVALFNTIYGNSSDRPAVEYLALARNGVALTSACLWSLILLVAFFGRPLVRATDEFVRAARFGSILAILYMAFLPQTLFFNSVVNQDYLLIAAGSFVAVSLFFRLAVITDLLFAISLAAGLSKAFYVLPFGAIAAWHYWHLFSICHPAAAQRIREKAGSKAGITAIVITLFGSAVSIAAFLSFYCRGHYCYWLDSAGVFSDPRRFVSEVEILLNNFQTLALPADFHFDSAFAAFGWLDSFLGTGYAELYTVPVMMTVILTVILLPLALWNAEPEDRNNWLSALSAALIYFVISFFVLYFIAVLMQGWCGPGSSFGCGYQKRYELPLYGLFPAIWFSAGIYAIARICSEPAKNKFTQVSIFIALLMAQVFVSAVSFGGQVSTLSMRYFNSFDDLQAYQSRLTSDRGNMEKK